MFQNIWNHFWHSFANIFDIPIDKNQTFGREKNTFETTQNYGKLNFSLPYSEPSGRALLNGTT